MAQQTVVGIFDSASQAQQAVEALVSAGFSRSGIDLSTTTASDTTNSSAVIPDQHVNTSGTRTEEVVDDTKDVGDSIGGFFKSLFGGEDDNDDYKKHAEVGRNNSVVTVHAQNDDVQGSDPEALEMVGDGRLEFFCVMGAILAAKVPLAEIQGLPFAYADTAQVHEVHDGRLGALISRECAGKGLHRFQTGLLENGFRQIGMIDRPIRTADDLVGLRMRVPDGEIFRDLFTALETEPVTVNIRELYQSLKDRRVDGQENPLVVTEFNRLYEVTGFVSITNHMWSGFNLIANLAFWNRLPADVQATVERNVAKYVAAQRAYTQKLNRDLETSLAGRGLVFNVAEMASFRRKLAGGFYPRWRTRFGAQAWRLLEDTVGPIG